MVDEELFEDHGWAFRPKPRGGEISLHPIGRRTCEYVLQLREAARGTSAPEASRSDAAPPIFFSPLSKRPAANEQLDAQHLSWPQKKKTVIF